MRLNEYTEERVGIGKERLTPEEVAISWANRNLHHVAC